MSFTVQDLVADVITELSQVPGVATQIYSSGRIQQFIQNAITLELEEMWWPALMKYFRVQLDGTTGVSTTDLTGPISSIDTYEDIAAVFPDGSNKQLSALPPYANPYLQTSGSARFISPDYTAAHRPFKVWPETSTGYVVVWARQRPTTPIGLSDIVYLDRLLLTFDAAWQYAVDDGTVPAQVTKYEMLAVKRREQLKAAHSRMPLRLDSRFIEDWEESPQDTSFVLGESVLG